MHDDPVTRTFQSGPNHPDPARSDMMIETMMRDLTGRRHRTTLFLGAVGAIVALLTGLGLLQTMASGGDARDSAASLALLVPCWLMLVLFARRHWRHLHDHAAAGGSLPDVWAALLDVNRAARQRLLIVAGGWAVMLPLLLLAVSALRDSGRMSGQNAEQFLILAGGAMLAVAGFGLAKYRLHLGPERRRLESLLSEHKG